MEFRFLNKLYFVLFLILSIPIPNHFSYPNFSKRLLPPPVCTARPPWTRCWPNI